MKSMIKIGDYLFDSNELVYVTKEDRADLIFYRISLLFKNGVQKSLIFYSEEERNEAFDKIVKKFDNIWQ